MSQPTVPCADCGKLLWAGRECLPPGESRCKPCRSAMLRLRPHRPSLTTYDAGCRCDECRALVRAKSRRNYKAHPFADERPCAFCGATFVARHPSAAVCSVECRLAKKNAHETAKYHASPARQRVCAVCSEPFVAKKAKTLCSETCRKRRASQWTLQRRAQVLKVTTELVNPLEIFRRDKWRCYICDRRLSPTAKIPEPQTATIDHLVPISKGGSHGATNVRACCYPCNLAKGNRGGNEQLLLIG